MGRLTLDEHHQPQIGEVTRVVQWIVRSGGQRVFYVPTPSPPFRVQVHVDPTFVPAQIDPRSSEIRQFGAQVAFDFTQSPPPTG
jgi:hypothetical protein